MESKSVPSGALFYRILGIIAGKEPFIRGFPREISDIITVVKPPLV